MKGKKIMKTRKVLGIIGIVLSVFALVGVVVARELANISILWSLIPVATLVASLVTAYVKSSGNKVWYKVIAWTLVGITLISSVVVAIFFGWFCLIPIAVLFGLLSCVNRLYKKNKTLYWIFGVAFILVVVIGIILWGVSTLITNIDGLHVNQVITNKVIANEIEATEIEATEAIVDDMLVRDDVMVGGNLAVNNDVVINQGNINVEQGDVNVEEGDLNVGGNINVTEPPATEPPATEPPATEPPATEPPATEPPATEPPATEPPATEPPATEPAVTPKFTLVDSGDDWWIVKFEGINSKDITVDGSYREIQWLSANTLKVIRLCNGECAEDPEIPQGECHCIRFYAVTDEASGEVIYLF